jgi:hypothetical protein
MPIPTSPLNLTAAQITALNTALDTIVTTLTAAGAANLTKEEIASLQAIGDTRQPFVDRTMQQHVVNYPTLLPNFVPLTEAQKHYTNANALKAMLLKISKINEMADECRMVADHYAFEYMRDVYQNAQRGKSRNVLGSDVVYEDLKPLFEQSPTTPPPPVQP